MDEERLAERIAEGEGATVELKRSLADAKRIVETVAAMAGAEGGVVIVGVREDGTVVGWTEGAGEIERLVQQVLTGTDPRVYVRAERARVGGLPVLVLHVPPGDGPHLAFGRAFHRVGPTTVALTRDEYERRLLDRLRESAGFERRSDPEWTTDRIDGDEVRRFCRLASGRLRHPLHPDRPEDVLAALRLWTGERLNVAGTLLFGADPQAPLPQAVVRARASRGASEDAASLEGTLFRQIEEATAFVARNLRVRTVRRRPVREERPELLPDAVREAVANAVAHRDYRSTAPVQLRLDDAGLEVWNPGHLPPPLTVAALRAPHPSIPPNPLIARALFLAGFVEEWGTGTLRMAEAQRAAGAPEPLFEVTGEDGFRVVLPLPGALPPGLPPRAVRILGDLAPGDPIGSAEYAERAGVARRTALLDLERLEQAGLVRREGTGRATRWVRS